MAAVGLLGLLSCAEYLDLPIVLPGPADQSPEAEMAIRELAVRNLLAGIDSLAFISFKSGSQWNPRYDPPPEFIELVSDLGTIWLPGSICWDWINTHGGAELELSNWPPYMEITVFWKDDLEAGVDIRRGTSPYDPDSWRSARAEWRDGTWVLRVPTTPPAVVGVRN
jgi:hypothetical protein